MANVQRTHLPGVGDRHDFVTEAGDRIGIVSHRDGHRELIVYDREDPDRCGLVVRLSEDEVRCLSELCSDS
ncbi:MAG: hypothetical protein M3N16_00515 [Actinomycetota bacterium]|nr:hypothetical protein [Actinomycetota bacterium]